MVNLQHAVFATPTRPAVINNPDASLAFLVGAGVNGGDFSYGRKKRRSSDSKRLSNENQPLHFHNAGNVVASDGAVDHDV